jgi:hypothetical protein
MKTIFAHIEQAKAHPHHVRKQIAFLVAGAGAGLVAFIWIGLSLAMDSFALKGPTSFGQGTNAQENASGTQLAAVGAALPSVAESTKPRIEIVDAMPTAPKVQTENTYIPF